MPIKASGCEFTRMFWILFIDSYTAIIKGKAGEPEAACLLLLPGYDFCKNTFVLDQHSVEERQTREDADVKEVHHDAHHAVAGERWRAGETYRSGLQNSTLNWSFIVQQNGDI